MPKIEFYLNKIVHYGLYAILLTPLAFWPRAVYPFLTPKFILFQVLVEIVFGAWLILKIIDFRNRGIFDFGNQLFLRKNYILLALSGFIVISFISAIFGVDFSRSFWGIGPRLTGLWAELHFFAWFLVLIGFSSRSSKSDFGASLKSDFSWQRYINFSFFIALIVAASAFYQNPKWTMAAGSTIFNNPTFVAPYFIFHFFWGLYQTINLKSQISNLKNWKNWFFAAGAALLFIVIILAQIRGAILGLLTGLFVFGVIMIFSGVLSRRAKIAVAAAYLILIAAVLGFWSFRGAAVIKNNPLLSKIARASLTETTVQTRLLDWRIAIAGFKDRPIFGVGPENYNYVFNAHYNPEFVRFAGDFAETWSDKPHNAFLEILTETGVIGFLAYALAWIAAASALFKIWRSGVKILAAAFASGFLAYLGAVFFAFDSFGSWFGLYLTLAFLVSQNSNTNDANKHTNNTNKNQWINNLFVSFVLIGLFVLEYFNYGIWRANLADADAIRTFQRNPRVGLMLFEKSLSYHTPYKAEYQFDFAASAVSAVQKNISLPYLEDTLNFALEEMDKAIAAHPKNAAYYSDAAKLYNILSVKIDASVAAQAEAFAKKSLELSPGRQETFFHLAQAALTQKDVESAIKWTKQAIDAYPEWNKGRWYLGRIYFATRRYREAAAEIKKAVELGYMFENPSEVQFARDLLGDEFMRRIGY